MSWYDSPRHRVSHTDMYYLEPHHTHWGFSNELCRITLIRVGIDSNEYKSAVGNSRISQKRIDDETDKIKIACLQAIEPLCPDVQRIILGEVQKANSIDHPWLFLYRVQSVM